MFQYSEEYQFAVNLAKEAAQLFIPAYNSHKDIEVKDSSSDLVTETDKAIEQLIFNRITEKFPSHGFIGEETVSESGNVVFEDKPTWIVDPIDGTMNFVHCYPHTCIVIGFSVHRTVQFGVVYNPVLGELYTGRKGFGAELNGAPIRVTGETRMNRALLLCECGSRRDVEAVAVKARNITSVLAEPDPCHGIRMQGSAALNMCAVARGAADGYWESGMRIWDMAAASVVVREAGGVILSPKVGEAFSLLKRRVVCASSVELGTVLQSRVEHIEFPSD